MLTGAMTLSKLSASSGRQRWFELSPLVTSSSSHGQEYWRLITCHFPFDRAVLATVGFILLYRFRFVERQFGSTKFATFLVWIHLLSSGLQYGGLRLRWFTSSMLTSGPFPLIGAMCVFYYFNVPILHPAMFRLGRGPDVRLLLLLLCCCELD